MSLLKMTYLDVTTSWLPSEKKTNQKNTNEKYKLSSCTVSLWVSRMKRGERGVYVLRVMYLAILRSVTLI